MRKNERGITLIALVITIIVLLILAGVSIATLAGEDGIIMQSNEASVKTKLGEINEAIEIYKSEKYMGSLENFSDANLADNESLASRIIVNDTGRNILILKDLSEINVSGSNGKGYGSIPDGIQTITDLEDVYVKDLTDGNLYYISNGKVISINGSTAITEFPYEKVEANVADWQIVDNGDSTVSLVRYIGSNTNTEIVIPNWYNGKRVKSIRYQNVNTIEELAKEFYANNIKPMFQATGQVTKNMGTETVTFPINTIITEIKISEGIEEIGVGALFGLTKWSGELHIPDSVSKIGDAAFFYNQSLSGTLKIPNYVTRIEVGTFAQCSGFTGDLIIGDNVEHIGFGAFSDCTGFNGNLIIGNGVKEIGESAFYGCFNFTGDLTIGDKVETIGKACFQDSTGFNGILTIGSNVKNIGDYAFCGCEKLQELRIRGTGLTSIGERAFLNCPQMKGNIVISSSTIIGSEAFNNTLVTY